MVHLYEESTTERGSMSLKGCWHNRCKESAIFHSSQAFPAGAAPTPGIALDGMQRRTEHLTETGGIVN